MDFRTLRPDGTFDLDPNFVEITDPVELATERVLKRWMDEDNAKINQKGANRLHERLTWLMKENPASHVSDVLREEAMAWARNISDVKITIALEKGGTVLLDAHFTLADGSRFRRETRFHPDRLERVNWTQGDGT